jgi:hypothetical protein
MSTSSVSQDVNLNTEADLLGWLDGNSGQPTILSSAAKQPTPQSSEPEIGSDVVATPAPVLLSVPAVGSSSSDWLAAELFGLVDDLPPGVVEHIDNSPHNTNGENRPEIQEPSTNNDHDHTVAVQAAMETGPSTTPAPTPPSPSQLVKISEDPAVPDVDRSQDKAGWTGTDLLMFVAISLLAVVLLSSLVPMAWPEGQPGVQGWLMWCWENWWHVWWLRWGIVVVLVAGLLKLLHIRAQSQQDG